MTIAELRQAVADLEASGRNQSNEYNAALGRIRGAEAQGDDLDAAGVTALESDRTALETLSDAIDAAADELATRRTELADAETAAERDRMFAASRRTAPGLAATTREPDPERTHGFHDLGEFAVAVRNAHGGPADERLAYTPPGAAPTNYHQERGGSAGEGYSVPPQFREAIYELVFAEPDLMTYCLREPTTSNQVKIIADETTPWGSTGVQANWRGEGAQMSASKMAEKEVSVDLHELYAFVIASDDLLEDAPRLSGRLSNGAASAIRWKASEAVMTGTGSGQPDGYFGHASEVVVAKEAGQAADTVVALNVANMFARSLNPMRSVWIAHQSILPQLMTMVIGNQPIWTPANAGFRDAPGGFLLGRPVLFSNHAKTLGDKGDIQFLDLGDGYYLPEKTGGIKFAESMHLYFDYAMQAFRWRFRLGGRPLLSGPVSPANGAATLSHFVQLAERA